MSTGNIAKKIPVPEGLIVVFNTKSGGTKSYLFTGDDAEAVMTGTDPAQLSGTPLD